MTARWWRRIAEDRRGNGDVAAMIVVVPLALGLVLVWVWFGRQGNPDHGPVRRHDWPRATVADAMIGDVVLAFALSPKPETVVGTAPDDGHVILAFRSGRTRRVPASTVTRLHRPPNVRHPPA